MNSKMKFILLLLFLILLFCMLYYYKQIGDEIEDNKKENTYRAAWFVMSFLLFILSIVLINKIIQQTRSIPSWSDYGNPIIVSLISTFSFSLFYDNILRWWIITRSSEIIFGIIYRIYYSFFLSLCTMVIIGGYYYIKNGTRLLVRLNNFQLSSHHD